MSPLSRVFDEPLVPSSNCNYLQPPPLVMTIVPFNLSWWTATKEIFVDKHFFSGWHARAQYTFPKNQREGQLPKWSKVVHREYCHFPLVHRGLRQVIPFCIAGIVEAEWVANLWVSYVEDTSKFIVHHTTKFWSGLGPEIQRGRKISNPWLHLEEPLPICISQMWTGYQNNNWKEKNTASSIILSLSNTHRLFEFEDSLTFHKVHFGKG